MIAVRTYVTMVGPVQEKQYLGLFGSIWKLITNAMKRWSPMEQNFIKTLIS